jgi:hypothetical protein
MAPRIPALPAHDRVIVPAWFERERTALFGGRAYQKDLGRDLTLL